jgi:hypothetical protein
MLIHCLNVSFIYYFYMCEFLFKHTFTYLLESSECSECTGFFVHKRVISAVKRAEFVSDKMLLVGIVLF